MSDLLFTRIVTKRLEQSVIFLIEGKLKGIGDFESQRMFNFSCLKMGSRVTSSYNCTNACSVIIGCCYYDYTIVRVICKFLDIQVISWLEKGVLELGDKDQESITKRVTEKKSTMEGNCVRLESRYNFPQFAYD